jgi:uncharacterized membrane protein
VSNSLLGDAININDSGIVTVQSQQPLGAFAWNLKRATITVLPSLGGIDRPTVYNINNRGQIVGVSSNVAEQNRAVVWEPNRGHSK